MENTHNTTQQNQRRLNEIREEEDRRIEEQRANEQAQRKDDEKSRGEGKGDATTISNKQADNLKVDDQLKDSQRKEDTNKADDRKADDRKAEDRRAEDDLKKERRDASTTVAPVDTADHAKIPEAKSSQIDRGLADQADKSRTETAQADVASNPTRGPGKNVLDPKDLENQERQANTPRPAGERANSPEISPAQAQAERDHVVQGKINQQTERAAMTESLARMGKSDGKRGEAESKEAKQNSVAERTSARNALQIAENTKAGKVSPSENTAEYASKAEVKLDFAKENRVELAQAPKAEKTSERTL